MKKPRLWAGEVTGRSGVLAVCTMHRRSSSFGLGRDSFRRHSEVRERLAAADVCV